MAGYKEIVSRLRTCPECGDEESLRWRTTTISSGIADGRLAHHDVRVALVLGCEECSETLLVVDADSESGNALLDRVEVGGDSALIFRRDCQHVHGAALIPNPDDEEN